MKRISKTTKGIRSYIIMNNSINW